MYIQRFVVHQVAASACGNTKRGYSLRITNQPDHLSIRLMGEVFFDFMGVGNLATGFEGGRGGKIKQIPINVACSTDSLTPLLYLIFHPFHS